MTIQRSMLSAALGLIVLVVAAIIGFQRYQFIATGHIAAGRVTGVPFGGSHPKVEFQLESGEKVSFPQGGIIFGYKTGDIVQVLYDAKAPRQTACIQSFGAIWGVCALLSILGLMLIFVSVL
jgi:hypothetical protein